MIQIALITRNATIVRSGLEQLRRRIPAISRKRIYDALMRAKAKVTAYPAQRPGQTYRRTGRYRRGWKVQELVGTTDSGYGGYTLKGEAISPGGRNYTVYVGGDEEGKGQAWMHKGRWIVARGAVLQEAEGLPRSIQDSIGVVARGALESGVA